MVLGLAVFGGVIATAKRIAEERTGDGFWISCAAFATIAFNLTRAAATLTGAPRLVKATTASIRRTLVSVPV